MKKHFFFILILIIPLISSSQNDSSKSNAPKWAQKTPKSNSKIFAVGKGTSASADVAYRKSVLDANKMLAESVGSVVTSKTTRIISSVENGNAVEKKVEVIRKSVTANLKGVEQIDKHQTQEGEIYIVHVLLSIPNKAISRSIVNGITSDSSLLGKLSSSKAYKDLLSEANK